jgi:hypothetical protein
MNHQFKALAATEFCGKGEPLIADKSTLIGEEGGTRDGYR